MRGELRIYAGAAAGVGTTYAMLDEGISPAAGRGADVMVGCVETHQRPNTTRELVALTGSGDGSALLDLEDVLRRRPAVVLVDELAVDNPYRECVPPSVAGGGGDHRSRDRRDHDPRRRAHRVARRPGAPSSAAPVDLVPDDFLRSADQIELVDVTPEAIRRRIAHGNVFADDSSIRRRSNCTSRTRSPSCARSLLFWLADRLTAGADDPREARERVVVAVTGGPGSDAVVRRAARLAQRSRAQLIGVHVRRPGDPASRRQLDERRALVGHVGGSYHEIESNDVARALVDFAETERATQLVLGTSARRRIDELMGGSVINEAIRRAERIDVHVISYPAATGHRPRWAALTGGHVSTAITRRRRTIAWVLGAVALIALTAVLVPVRDDVAVSNSLALYLLVVVWSPPWAAVARV